MVLTPGSYVGARVTTNKESSEDLTRSTTVSPTESLTSPIPSIGNTPLISSANRVSSLLQALAGADTQQKRPKTIHRCILQRVNKNKKEVSSRLVCHVCDSSYVTYDMYFNHLMDATCAKRKVEKAANQWNSTGSNSPTSPDSNKSISLEIPRSNQVLRANSYESSPDKRNQEVQIEAEYISLSSPPAAKRMWRKRSNSFDQRTFQHKVARPEVMMTQEHERSEEPDVAPLNLSTRHDCTEEHNVIPTLVPISTNKTTGSVSSISSAEDTVASGFDERAASETLLLLSGSITGGINKNGKASLKVGKLGNWSMPSDARAANLLNTAANVCPHLASATLPAISLSEYAADQATLATLKVQLTTLLVGLLGESRLTAMGSPDTDILNVLHSVLELAKCQSVNGTDGCTPLCPQISSSLNQVQLKFRVLKREIAMARHNINKLLEICVPDATVWEQNQWHAKTVESVLSEIISEQNSLLLPKVSVIKVKPR